MSEFEKTVLAELQNLHRRFDQVDQRFDQVDQRFDQVDQRFEQVDQRFEQVDRRFEQVDRRFEQVDRRFEQVDRRFEQVDQRFEGIDQALLDTRHQLRLLGLEFERFRSDQQVQKEVLLELRDQHLHQRLSRLEKRAL
ncbi:MAG: hypothetical protein J0I12_04390 [Candidatus Eremiobacteraeota bacterium]|nr:hypothetical protein [Candidatus Eremiobacteraeota bacterium]